MTDSSHLGKSKYIIKCCVIELIRNSENKAEQFRELRGKGKLYLICKTYAGHYGKGNTNIDYKDETRKRLLD